MKIILKNAGKRYNREWIFNDINLNFQDAGSHAILGGNGSGKSTLLQIISGKHLLSEGSITYEDKGDVIPPEEIFKHISIAAPYLELFEEFTLEEALNFHNKFKELLIPVKQVIELAYLEKSAQKPIKYFSSGMKQRVRLSLSILSKSQILLLDEPTSNLDNKGIEWYQSLIKDFTKSKQVFVCSNSQIPEYNFCKEIINIEDYKQIKQT